MEIASRSGFFCRTLFRGLQFIDHTWSKFARSKGWIFLDSTWKFTHSRTATMLGCEYCKWRPGFKLLSRQIEVWRHRRRAAPLKCKHSAKFVVERKCVTKLMNPLSFYMVSCFYTFLALPKHSFDASLLGSSSLPIFVCMHWESLGNTCGCCLPCGSSFALLGRSLQPASLLEGKLFFGHVLATHSC